ncbi:winged helix DNA-binding domain-containing protein [Salininema proteolyticum]|uniref:Winged helix DNA-binding domain-containing protein n=1 Tax=Salininema proteolyticum TaxID=1607685 RepID=A0ABV8U1Y3_9ACTN
MTAARISDEQRRRLLTVRHRLAPDRRAATPEEVADSLVALHATDPASVYLSLAARLREPDLNAIDHALYRSGALTRLHAMRHTVFVFPGDVARNAYRSTAHNVASRERRALAKLVEDNGLPLSIVDEARDAVLKALEKGPMTGAELVKTDAVLRTPLLSARGKSYESRQSLGSRVVRSLGIEGVLVRGRPRGSWTGSLFTWMVGDEPGPQDRAEAQAELARHWLRSFGPGTEADLKWWTAWTVADTRKALSSASAVPVELGVGAGFALPETLDALDDETPPSAALLPALDPTPMGWKERDWYLAEEVKAPLFDRNGNIGPTVWWDGAVVGGWAQRPDGEVVWRALADIGAEAEAAVASEAERIAAFIGPERITPRFRTPLEKELAKA